ncbi:MAG: GvpL/GvpF family gas vesicle protein [Rhodospirillaceae bacterium]|nr:MAG: GvpL/GvpF family gas vesicle protein [Rhodospirillaceae bacterium]
MMPLAVFAIIPADCARILWAGVTEVQVIVEGAFAAVVAPVLSLNGCSQEQLAPRLLAHQRIIEAVMATSPVLPVQFATVVPDGQTVAHVLEEGAPLFRQGFIDFSSRVEMELRVLWVIEDILREIAGTERIIARKAEIAAREAAGAVGPEERVTLGRLVAWELE